MMTARSYLLLVFCFCFSSFLRVQAQCPTFNSVTSTNVTCNPGPNNGTIAITLNANGYGGNYNYQILGIPATGPIIFLSFSTTSTTHTFTGLAAATYTVFVSPDAPCGNISGPPQFVTQPAVLAASSTITAACTAGAGAIDLTVSGGNGGNTFLWSPGGQATEDIGSLSAGSYSVTITDVNSCSINVGPLVVPGPPSTGAISGDPAVCQNEAGVAYNVSATSGSTYAWTISNGSQVSGGNSNSITVNWTSTTPGNVQVVETNSAGCAGSPVNLPVSIVAVPATGAITGDNNVCTNETGVNYQVGATAGSTYAWTVPSGATVTLGQGTNSINVTWGSTAGNVQVIETNSSGCVGTAVVFAVAVNALPTTSAISGDNSVCANETGVAYDVTNTPTSTYNWTVPAGASITSGQGSSSIVVSWGSTSGNVAVIETNAAGCAGTQVVRPVTVNALPNPTFTSGATAICANASSVYTTQAGRSNYVWSVSGGTITAGGSATDNSATILWTTSGSVSVNYTNAAGCTATSPVIRNVTVTAAPVPTFTTGAATVCVNGSSVYTTQAGQNSYVWSVTGGTITAGGSASDNTATIQWTSTGSVSVSYTDTNGCTPASPTVQNVTVNSLPVPTFTGGAASACINTSSTYTTQAGQSNYVWNVTGGTITAGGSATDNTATILWTSTGTVSVSYTNLAGCAAAAPATQNVTVNSLPTPTFTAGATAICANASSVYTTQPGQSSYVWNVTGGTITAGGSATDNSATILWTTTGSVSVNYANAAGCTATSPVTRNVTVTAAPVPTFTTGAATVCVNGSSVYTTQAGQSSYVWSVTGGTITAGGSASDNTATIQWTSTGSVSVSYTDTNGCTPASPTVQNVTVNSLPVPTFTGGAASACINTSSTYTTQAGQSNYVWNVTGGTITAGGSATDNTAAILWTSTGTVSVSYTNPAGCAAAVPATQNVTVNPLPTPTFTAGPTTTCVNASSAYTTQAGQSNYVWNVTGGTITSGGSATDNSATILWTSSGSVSVNYTNTNGCTALTPTVRNVTVNPLPTSVASGGGTVCSGATLPNVQFTFTGTAPFDFSYTDGTSTVNVDNYASATYTIFNAPAGTYNVTALVDQGGAGCTQTSFGSSVSVVVTPLSVPTISGPPPPEICQRTSVTFTTESGKTNYVWTFTGGGQTVLAGGSATDNSVTVSWGSTGAKSVNVRYTDNGCTSQITSKAITVRARPNLNITGSATVCEGATGNVYTTANGLTNYTWSVSPGGTITAGGGTSNRTATITWVTAGAQTVSVNATNTFGCTDDTPPVFNVTVNPLPSGQIAGTTTLCSGASTPLTFTLPAGTFDVTYTDGSGSFVATGISSGATVNVNPASTRTYTITSITSAAGCTVTAPSASITGSAIITVVPSPSASLAVSPQDATICSGTSTNILVQNSESGVSYQLRNDADDTPIGAPVAGNGAQISLSTLSLTSSTTFNVFASLGGCSVELTQTAAVSVDQAPDLNLSVSPTLDPICSGGSTTVRVLLSEAGASYQLRSGTTDIGSAVPGTGGTILLPTGSLTSTTVFNVLVTNGVCTPAQLATMATVNVSGTIDAGLSVSAQTDPICSGSSTNIQVANSEAGVNYQLRNNANDATIGVPVPGNGSTINLPTDNLTANTTFNILASSGTCAIQLNQLVTVTITALPVTSLTVVSQAASVCPTTGTNIDIQNSESGVSYQLRNDFDDSNVLAPVPGNNGLISLPTGNLSVGTTFNILATRGGCSVELGTTPVVNISPVPSNTLGVVPQSGSICSGNATAIDVGLTELGVDYQLRNNLNNAIVGAPQAGNAGTLSFATGILTTSTDFNVVATLGGCSVQLSQLASVTVNPSPAIGLPVTPVSTTICEGSATNIQVSNSEIGVDYQLRNDLDDSPVGSAVPGTGVTINLPTLNLITTTTFNVFATVGSCSAELSQVATVTVNPVPSGSLSVSTATSPICEGASTNIQIAASEVGVSYQLRDNSNDLPVGAAVVGDGTTILLNTGTLPNSIDFNVLATSGSCSVELTQTASVVVTPAPNLTLTVSAQATPICAGTGTSIDVVNSEAGVTYHLRNDADDSVLDTQVGTGGTLGFATGPLSATTVYNVLAEVGACSLEMALKPQVIVNPLPVIGLTASAESSTICAGDATNIQVESSEATATYQLRNDSDNSLVGSAVAGTGGTILLPTGNLLVTTTFNVLASIGSCSNELTQQITVTTVPGASALLTVTEQVAAVCSGGSTNIQVLNSEVGVDYQLRNNADDSPIGSVVAGDGSTILLPTLSLTSSTTFNVLAISASCSVELVDLATVNVDNTPSISLSLSATSPICEGQSSIISLNGSESGVSYQLRDGTTAIGTPVAGTGGTINFGTGSLTTTTTFNILATRGVCTPVQLTNTATVTVNPIAGDNTVFGSDTWIAYVYNDGAISGPSDVDFADAKYRGYLSEADMDALGGSTYNTTTDVFDLNLSNSVPVSGPNVCGTYLNDYSIRFRMRKTMTAGIYTFTIGGDDGIRLFIDGSPITVTRVSGFSPTDSYTDHAYGTYTSNAVCLAAGAHDFTIEYYENAGFSRATFSYQTASAPTVTSPVTLCVNAAAPTLTASSTDPLVTGYRWYSDSGLLSLVATTQNYTPSATELDMTVSGTSDFFVTAVFACGESLPAQVDVTLQNAGTISVNPSPVQICQSASLFDLSTVVTATPSGGTLTFSGTGITGNSFDASQAVGAYPINVSYSSGSCSANSGFTLDIISSASITVPGSAVALCQSSLPIDLTTLVSATPVGGTFTFTGSGVTGANFDPAAQSGTVTITVDYTAGTCTDSKTFDISVVSSASLVTSNTIVCPNAGTLDLTTLVSGSPSGGTFTFTGSPAITGNIFDPSFAAGSIVTVNVQYAAGGCSTTGSLLVSVRSSIDALCTGGGGTGNCATVVITPVPSPATCTLSNGSITFNINPAVPAVNNTGVKITIDGISTTNQSIARTNFNDPVFPNLPIGTYDYSIEYGDPSCVKTGQVTIDRSGTVGVPVLSNAISPTCFGTATGSVTIDVPGETGNLLEWSLDGVAWSSFTAGSQVTGVPAGDQVISVRRNSSDPCASGALLSLAAPAEIAVTLTPTNATCSNNDGSLLVGTVTGGTGPYTFELNGVAVASLPTADTFTGLTAGTYTLGVRDALGCSKNFTAILSFPGYINHTVPTGSAAGCSPDGKNGTISFTISDPGSYLVGYTTDPVAEPANYFDPLNPVVNIGGLTNGVWYVWMKPASGSVCPTKDPTPITIQGIIPVTADAPVSSAVNCPSDTGSILIQNIKGAPGLDYTYELVRGTNIITGAITSAQANGAVTLSNLIPGDYQLKLLQVQSTLNAACATPVASSIMIFSVTSPEEINMQYTVTSASCANNDGRILIESLSGGTAPFTFELDGLPIVLDASNQITGLEGKVYTVSVIDSKGCRKDYTPLEVNFPGYVDITTPVGSSPSCLPSGGNGVISFQINQAGSYLVGYTTDLAAEPTNYFNPASSSVLIPGLANGNWFIWLKRSDGTGCVTKYPDPVSIEGVYPVTFEAKTGDLSCFGEKASIILQNMSGAPGVDYTYTLLNTADNTSKQGTIQFAQALGEFSITDVAPGNYSVLVSQVQTSVVTVCTDPILSEATLLEIKGPSKALDTLYVVKAISLPDLATGSALVGVSPSGSEPYEATLELVEPLLSSQSYFADWTPVNINNQNLKFERTFTNLFAGTYQLGLRDAAGCEKSFEVKIDVDTNISIPNIFTPNGDGVNDIFYIRNLPPDAALIITNRWGKEVFRSGSYQNNWSGGETADGVYYYKLSLPNESITGWVEIVRGN